MLSIHLMNLSGVDLNLLLVLEAALEERSVTRAAKRIGLSQPATSSALRRLREILHDPLLVRSGRQMVLTARGEELLPTVAESLRQIREALEDKPAFDPSQRGRTFTFIANDYAEWMLMPDLLKRIQTGKVRLRFIRTDTLFQAPVEPLSSGGADLAVGFADGALSLPSSVLLRHCGRRTTLSLHADGIPASAVRSAGNSFSKKCMPRSFITSCRPA
jgi:DNA-binding transcriptional LysR family regulator